MIKKVRVEVYSAYRFQTEMARLIGEGEILSYLPSYERSDDGSRFGPFAIVAMDNGDIDAVALAKLKVISVKP